MNEREPFSVIGVDLALLNTGVVLVNPETQIEFHQTIRIGGRDRQEDAPGQLANSSS